MEQKYPMRINKYLAFKNIASRREADSLIQNKKVFINGKLAVLGDQVQENDKVEVKNFKKKNIYLAFYKPRGIATHSSQENEKSIKDIIHFSENVFPIGRLDKDSHGLIILTNNGLITDKLLNPENFHEKEYIVKVDQKIKDSFLNRMQRGVKLDDGYLTQECKIKQLSEKTFSIILTEGKKRQIRRMCDACGYRVLDLKRIRVMNVKLQDLKSGNYRQIIGKEESDFLKELGL